jgi:hypothetical protein
MVRQVVDWAVHTEASTRSSGLLRLALVPVIWSRWAIELLLYIDLSPTGIALSVNYFLATTLMFFGVFSRFTSLWTGLVLLTMYHYFGLELGREPWTHHHTYILAVSPILCAATPCGRSFSFDRWWALRKASKRGEPPPPERGNVWGLRLVALQMSTIYFFASIDKTNWGFLSGDRMEHYLAWFYFGSEVPHSGLFHATMFVSAVATVALEYALAFGLLFRRTRPWLVVPGLLLHGLFYVLLPVSTYTATMWVLYLGYLDPDAVHRWLDRMQGHEPVAPER